MRLSRFLFVGCLSALSLSAHAETLNSLYQVHEPVSTQAPEERDQALQKALETLVIRLTGDARAIQNPGLAQARKDPQQIVSKYGYEAGPPSSLVVDFDPVSTDQALHQAGLAQWGSNRPSILAWWLNDATDGSALVGDGQVTAKPLKTAAEHRGLPLRLPLADLSEQLVATGAVLDAGKVDALRPPSERYNADALLAVHAHEDGGQWQAKWRLWLGDLHEQGAASGTDQAALADAVMLAVSERLAPRFVVKPGATSGLTLEVQGVTLDHYAELGRLLEPFGPRLLKLEGQTATYQVTGNPDQLRAQLSLNHLQESPPDTPAAPPSAPIGATPAAVPPVPLPVQPANPVLRFHY